MGKKGRPPKAGERYPSGKLKPKSAIEPIAPAQWQRIATEAKRKTIDARLGTELGRLLLHGEISNKHMAVAVRVGEVYRDFERHKRLRRNVQSPSYGAAGDTSIAEELMNPEALERLGAGIRAATEKF